MQLDIAGSKRACIRDIVVWIFPVDPAAHVYSRRVAIYNSSASAETAYCRLTTFYGHNPPLDTIEYRVPFVDNIT